MRWLYGDRKNARLVADGMKDVDSGCGKAGEHKCTEGRQRVSLRQIIDE